MKVYYCNKCGALFVGEVLARSAFKDYHSTAGDVQCRACHATVGDVDDMGTFKPINCAPLDIEVSKGAPE